MTLVHLNRVLRVLPSNEAMTIARGTWHIMYPAKLNHIAGFDENYLHRRPRRAVDLGSKSLA